MKTFARLIKLSLLVLVAGCVPSLQPLYTDRDVVFDPALVGVWAQDKDTRENWAFTKDDEKSYKLVYTDKDGKAGPFVAHLLKVGSTQFLDLYPLDPKLAENNFYKLHLVAAHTFLLVSQIQPTLRMAPLNPDWLKKFLATNPTAIRHETVDDRIVLTAGPGELQAFLLAHLKTKDAFPEPVELERIKPTNAAPSAP